MEECAIRVREVAGSSPATPTLGHSKLASWRPQL